VEGGGERMPRNVLGRAVPRTIKAARTEKGEKRKLDGSSSGIKSRCNRSSDPA